MKKIFVICILLILLSLTASFQLTYAKPSDAIWFDKIKTGNLINTFIQDRDGFFWIGSVNGLYKYDGYTFKKYLVSSDSIVSFYVTTLYEDSEGLIWIGTQSGISVYNKNTNTFTNHIHDPTDSTSISNDNINDGKIQAIQEDSNGIIWIATENGLNKFDKTNQSFTSYQDLFIDSDIWSIYVDENQFLWVGTANGLHKFDPQREIILKHYKSNKDNPDSLHGNFLTSIIKDRDGELWIGTKNHGLNRLSKDEKTFTHYRKNPENSNSLSDDVVFGLFEDIKGRLWISTVNGGLNMFDKAGGTFTSYRHDPDDSGSISENYTNKIFQDKLGVIWISSYKGTLNRIDPGSRKFQRHVHHPKNPNSLSKGDYISQVIEDQDGIIWVTIGGSGLDRYDRKNNTFTHYRHDPDDPDSLPELSSQSLMDDNKGSLWIATTNWIVQFDKKTKQVVQRFPAINWPSSPIADSTNSNIIWWGTWGSGLLKFNKSTGNISYLTSSSGDPDEAVSANSISYLYQDNSGMIWLSTRGGGLDKFNPRTEKVIAKYKHIPADPETINSNTVHQIYKHSVSGYWVTTDKGLDQFDPKTGKFKRLTKQNGLFPINSSSQIIEDRQGYLWITGYNSGELVRFSPSSGDYKLYTTDDGVLSNIGGSFRALQTRDGALYFFSRDGITFFNPERIKDNLYHPPVFLTSLTQGGEPIKTGKAIEYVEKIQLDWQHNFFEFEVVALNYRYPEHNKYRYKLEGVDHDWFYSKELRQGRYTGLDPGEYDFKIQGSNNDGIWNEEGTSIIIKVTPPFWRTWYFYLACIVITLGIILFVGYYYLKLKINQSLIEQSVQRENHTKELNEVLETKQKIIESSLKEKETLLQEIQQREKRFEDIVELLPGAVVEMDTDLKISYFNRAGLILFGYTHQDIQKGMMGIDLLHPDDRKKAVQRIAEYHEGKRVPSVEYRVLRKDKKNVPVLFRAIPVRQVGKITGYRAVMTDISRLKQVEKEIRASLKEKETLLQEIHHRVKNNLTVVSSLLRLQASSMSDERLKEALTESQNRIYAMSAVHESLYSAKDISEIDLKSYLSKITGTLIQTYSVNKRNIKLNIESEKIAVNIEKASPIGLIINELISNSLKYAFPNEKQGKIEISAKKIDKSLQLIVMDNGVGIPEGLDWKNTKSLGLKLVRTLVENQLDGSIDLDNTNGIKFTIKFNIET
ncbi:MAG: PAS domain S-box protein [Deltaproteobacteria bacterium]|nr:PAS domain S-box protein [Deltaproteobacteria bacterium]MBT4527907.1 PAS domain S-box protein [Deltaproteobacteria bacterium]